MSDKMQYYHEQNLQSQFPKSKVRATWQGLVGEVGISHPAGPKVQQ